MTIEASQIISELNTSYPRSNDLLKEGDDHIRLIKANLKNTFPKVNSVVNMSSSTLNDLNNNLKIDTGGITIASGKSFNNGGGALKGVRTIPTKDDITDDEAMSWGTMKLMFRVMYPVGSLFMTNGINPATLPMFGAYAAASATEWVRHYPGRYLISSNTGGGSTYWDPRDNAIFGNSNGGTGQGNIQGQGFAIGSSNLPQHTHNINHNHTAGTSAAGNHAHTFQGRNETGRDTQIAFVGGNGGDLETKTTSTAGNHTHGVTVTAFNGNSSGGNGLNNVNVNYAPAAIGVAFWRRTK